MHIVYSFHPPLSARGGRGRRAEEEVGGGGGGGVGGRGTRPIFWQCLLRHNHRTKEGGIFTILTRSHPVEYIYTSSIYIL